jgi:AcrR family transcriptional regulator
MPMRAPGGKSAASNADTAAASRELVRQRVVEAAIQLLEREGRDAVTTRAVAVAAGLQPPAIYRLFGDKNGLLDAVAEHGFAVFLASKKVDPEPPDPVEDLREGWNLAVEFGLTNPALYALMFPPWRPQQRPRPASTFSGAVSGGWPPAAGSASTRTSR